MKKKPTLKTKNILNSLYERIGKKVPMFPIGPRPSPLEAMVRLKIWKRPAKLTEEEVAKLAILETRADVLQESFLDILVAGWELTREIKLVLGKNYRRKVWSYITRKK